MTPFVERWHDLANDLLGPPRLPRHPLITARFGIRAIRSAKAFAESTFHEDKTRASLPDSQLIHSLLSIN